MASFKVHRLASLFTAIAAVITLQFASTSADAASGLFRMKRTWWGGTPVSTAGGGPGVPSPYISTDYHPRLKGPNKAPPAIASVGTSTASGRPAQRFTAPSKFIKDYTYYGRCVPGTCFPGYPESKVWYSYWNLQGSFRPNNSRYGGASGPTTVVFPTTMGNPSPPLNRGNPLTPTTTPCAGSARVNGICGYLPHPLGTRPAGDPITFVDGNYDFSRAGSIMVTPGPNRFGGTMHFFYGANHTYYQRITINSPYISKAYGPQMDVRNPSADTVLGDVQYGGPFNIYRMTTQGYTRATTPSGGFYSARALYFYTLVPFTTGMVTAWQPFGGTNTQFTLSGYDNRTSYGFGGVVSMVRPRLVHTYKVPQDPRDPIAMTWASASAWQMDFHFIGGGCGDIDLDGFCDFSDNCSEKANPGQDDTDGDGCGNLCDADYDNNGTVGFSDFGAYTANGFGTTNELYNHTEPVTDTVGFGDFGFFTSNFGSTPGPSGTTAGTTACP